MDGNQKEEVREWRRGTKEVRKEVGGDVRALVRALDGSFFALFLSTHLFFQFFVLPLFSVFLLPTLFSSFLSCFSKILVLIFLGLCHTKVNEKETLFKNNNKKKQREHVKFRAK